MMCNSEGCREIIRRAISVNALTAMYLGQQPTFTDVTDVSESEDFSSVEISPFLVSFIKSYLKSFHLVYGSKTNEDLKWGKKIK